MEKKSNNKSSIILGIVLLILIVFYAIFAENSNDDITNNIVKENELYSNLNIDKSKLNVFYLNVGQADSTLMIMGEDVMLIDAGDESDGKNIVNFLKSQNITEIDYLIETHSDDDHSGGIENIIHNLKVNQIYMPQSAISKSEVKDEITINTFSDLEQTYNLGEATWQVLNVDNSENVSENKENDTSIVIQLNYENNKFLFMGDATSTVEKQLLNNHKLEKVDVLKVGHHGSNSSSSQNFLNTILPTYSIISVNNSEYSKHPSENTLQRLNSINSKIYRTDVNGTIWITSNGTAIEIKELDININGNKSNKVSMILEDKYSLIFYSKILPFSSTIV